jgi:hypothetical protein
MQPKLFAEKHNSQSFLAIYFSSLSGKLLFLSCLLHIADNSFIATLMIVYLYIFMFIPSIYYSFAQELTYRLSRLNVLRPDFFLFLWYIRSHTWHAYHHPITSPWYHPSWIQRWLPNPWLFIIVCIYTLPTHIKLLFYMGKPENSLDHIVAPYDIDICIYNALLLLNLWLLSFYIMPWHGYTHFCFLLYTDFLLSDSFMFTCGIFGIMFSRWRNQMHVVASETYYVDVFLKWHILCIWVMLSSRFPQVLHTKLYRVNFAFIFFYLGWKLELLLYALRKLWQ